MSLESWQVIDFDIDQDQMDWFPRLPATSVWRNRRWKLGMTRLNKMLIKLMMLMFMVEELQFAAGTGNECLECTNYPESVTILPAWQRPQGHGELGSPTEISLLLSNISLSPAPVNLTSTGAVYPSGSLEFDDLSFNQFFGGPSVFVNREDTNHLSVVQSSGHLPDIVIGVVAITSTIALATYLILRGRWFKKHGYPTARAFSPPGVNIQSERPDLSEKLLSRMLQSFHAGLMAVIVRLKGEQTRVLDDRQWASCGLTSSMV